MKLVVVLPPRRSADSFFPFFGWLVNGAATGSYDEQPRQDRQGQPYQAADRNHGFWLNHSGGLKITHINIVLQLCFATDTNYSP